jgi:UDP-glucuronate 4-epimerase
MDETFLVTGAGGCIGAWVVAQLAGEGTPVVALDASDDEHRLRLLLDDEALRELVRVKADITELEAVEAALDRHGVTRVIHLAALQVPFCRADPVLGARGGGAARARTGRLRLVRRGLRCARRP